MLLLSSATRIRDTTTLRFAPTTSIPHLAIGNTLTGGSQHEHLGPVSHSDSLLKGKHYQGMSLRRPFFFLLVDSFSSFFFLSSVFLAGSASVSCFCCGSPR